MFSKLRMGRVSLFVGALLMIVGAPLLVAVGGPGTGSTLFNSGEVSVRNAAETLVPTRPSGLTTVPASPSNDLKPILKGDPGSGATVRVYKNGTCTGTNFMDYSAAQFASGVQKRARENQTTEFSAVGIASTGERSACSDPISYVHDSITPTVTLTAPPNGSATGDSTPTFSGTGGRTPRDSGEVTVTVFAGSSTAGSVQEVLTATIDPGTGNYSVDASPALPDGTYTARASQTDAAGNTGLSTEQTFEIVTGHPAPTVSITTPGDGDEYDIGEQVTADYECASPGGSGIANCSGPVADGAPIDTADAGPHAFSVTAVDNDGFETTETVHYTVLDDTTAPVVTLTTPANGSAGSDSTPTFSGTAGTADRDDGDVTVTVYGGSSAEGSAQQVLHATADPGTGAYSVDASPALPDGFYTAQASQSDEDGNVGFSTAQTFRIVTGHPAPTVTITSPADGAEFDPGEEVIADYACESPGGPGIANCSGPVADGAPIDTDDPGPHSFSVTAVDNDGFETTVTAHYTVRSDDDVTAPVVTLTAPADGSTTSDDTPTFSGTAGTDPGDDADVSVAVYAGSSASGSPQQLLHTAVDPATGAYAIDASPALPDGTYTAVATQGDEAGNTASSTEQTFDIVTGHPAPEITIAAPTEGAEYAKGASMTAGYSCSSPGGPGIASCSGPVADGAPIDTAAAGPHAFSVSAVDNDGFETVKTVHYTVVAETPVPAIAPPPTVSISRPADGSTFVQGAEIRAAYSCTARGGTTLAGCAGPVADGALLDTDAIGPHAFSVTAVDSAGSQTVETSHYRVLRPGTIRIVRPARTFHRKGRLWVDTGFVAACPEKGPDCEGIVTGHRVVKAPAPPAAQLRFGHALVRIDGAKTRRLVYRLARQRVRQLARSGKLRIRFDVRLNRGTKSLATAKRTATLRP